MAASRRTPVEAASLMCASHADPHFFGSVRDIRDAVEVQSRRALALAAEVGLEVPLERRPVADVMWEALVQH